MLATAVAQAIFAAWPGIDVAVSGIFYDPDRGFWLGKIAWLQVVRTILRMSAWGLTVSALVIGLLAIARRRPLRSGIRPCLFTLACLALGPWLIVTVGLKDHWGRARPADITRFGGTATFTPAFQVADQCQRDCSFTSGEAASISMTAMILIVLAWPRASRSVRAGLVLGLGTVAAFGSGLRIAMGRHFLSDAVFSILICALVLSVLYRAMRMDRFGGFGWRDLRTDLTLLFTGRAPSAPCKTLVAPGDAAPRAISDWLDARP